ncbi:MAG: HD domain-containing protein [Pseudomonadota bacterium]
MEDLNALRCLYEEALPEMWATQPDTAHDLGHIRRVWRMAERIARVERAEVDWRVLLAATIFHDCVSLPKDAPDGHLSSAYAAEKAVAYLRKSGIPQDRLARIAHAIVAHSFSGGVVPESPEAKILSDADKLDALGAIGIARLFAVSGALGRPLYDAEDPTAQNRPLDGRAFALDHFETKLFRLPSLMHTREGRRIAEVRMRRMQAYRADLLAEL